MDSFTINHGLKLPVRVRNRDLGYPRGCSWVFDLQALGVYFAFHPDFDHTWRVSLA